LGKIPENPNKIPKFLEKIPENLGKNGAQRCFTSKNSPSTFNVYRKTSEDHFLKGHAKKRSAKVAQKLFWQVWKNLGKNPLHCQKFAYCYTFV